MAFFLQGWGRVDTSLPNPLYTLQGKAAAPPQIPHAIPPITIGSFRTYNYYADRIAADFDPVEYMILPGYFDEVRFDLEVGDVIYLYSAAPEELDHRAATAIVTAVNTAAPYVYVERINVGVGPVATDRFADGAVFYNKIQDVSAQRLLGNPQALEGVVEEIDLGNGLQFNGDALQVDYELMFQTSGTITAAEWNNMYDTPIRLIQNSNLNDLLVVERVLLRQIFGGVQYTGGGSVVIGYGDSPEGLAEPATTLIGAANINNINATSSLSATENLGPLFLQVAVGQDIYISNQDAPFATGNGNWEYDIWCKVI